MLDCTPTAFWQQSLVYVLPPVGALLSATALWVASRARDTSRVAHATSSAALLTSGAGNNMPRRNVWPQGVRDLKRYSSTTPEPGPISMWRGEPDRGGLG